MIIAIMQKEILKMQEIYLIKINQLKIDQLL